MKPDRMRALLRLAEKHGAVITGKPDGSEPVRVVFTPAAWRAYTRSIINRLNKGAA